MNRQELHKFLIHVASQSTSRKRKVGAVICLCSKDISTGDDTYDTIVTGWNYAHGDSMGPCEDENGNTLDNVIHAEVACINNYKEYIKDRVTKECWHKNLMMFITHPPCAGCLAAIADLGIAYTILGDFMKFDTSKLRYDLVPPKAIAQLADILTYGAKKYKPNNWRNVEDPDRYIAAMMRHIEAYRAGEINDPESGKPHLAHALTNIVFLIELEYKPQIFITNKGD